MIELPRAALVADEIAAYAEFFSFGTNDLTQMTYGFSRDDTRMFLKDYLKKGILRKDPFQSLDRRGVGYLVKMAVEKGRQRESRPPRRHLRRARRRPSLDRVLPPRGPGLRELLAVPRPRGAARGGPRRPQGEDEGEPVASAGSPAGRGSLHTRIH